MRGITLDTGALVALERKKPRAHALLRAARTRELVLTIPATVLAEWWRGQKGPSRKLRAGCIVERMDESLAEAVGETLADVRGASLVDAAVMTSAARRGDVVFTSDIEDLERLQRRFPTVRLVRV
ncbi:MAG: PIN domain-containing protein [Myxococcota bacterium]